MNKKITEDVKEVVYSHAFIKGVSAFTYAAVIDNYLFYGGAFNPDVTARNLRFGIAVAGGITSGSYIAPFVSSQVSIPDTLLFSGKTLETRMIEVTLGAVTAQALNGFILSGAQAGNLMSRVGVILLTDILSEYTADFFHSSPLSYLS